tara:strand:- start:2141 stop:2530 length:390 start_codon:yes stop_codon:yes gene_type:complete
MILFLMSIAIAEPPTYTEIEAGHVAPFSGYLLDPNALTLLAMNAKMGMQCPAEIDYQVGLMEAKKDREMRMLLSEYELEVSLLEDEVVQQKDRIEQLEKLKKPLKRGVWVAVGAALGVGTTIAIANAVN